MGNRVPDLDKFDLDLLKLVQSDASASAEALGAAVGLSGSAVLRRLRQLRETGIINREIAIVATDKLGPRLRIIANVELERDRADQLGALVELLQEQPGVVFRELKVGLFVPV